MCGPEVAWHSQWQRLTVFDIPGQGPRDSKCPFSSRTWKRFPSTQGSSLPSGGGTGSVNVASTIWGSIPILGRCVRAALIAQAVCPPLPRNVPSKITHSVTLVSAPFLLIQVEQSSLFPIRLHGLEQLVPGHPTLSLGRAATFLRRPGSARNISSGC